LFEVVVVAISKPHHANTDNTESSPMFCHISLYIIVQILKMSCPE